MAPTVDEVTSDGSRSFALAEDVEQCARGSELRPPSRLVTPGAINLKPKSRTGDLGCQVFDGTGVWTAPDDIECGDADGICSSGVCVDKIRVASSVTFAATSEPTNMLIVPTIPQSGSNERVHLENELADMLIRLLRWARKRMVRVTTTAITTHETTCDPGRKPNATITSRHWSWFHVQRVWGQVCVGARILVLLCVRLTRC